MPQFVSCGLFGLKHGIDLTISYNFPQSGTASARNRDKNSIIIETKISSCLFSALSEAHNKSNQKSSQLPQTKTQSITTEKKMRIQIIYQTLLSMHLRYNKSNKNSVNYHKQKLSPLQQKRRRIFKLFTKLRSRYITSKVRQLRCSGHF